MFIQSDFVSCNEKTVTTGFMTVLEVEGCGTTRPQSWFYDYKLPIKHQLDLDQ